MKKCICKTTCPLIEIDQNKIDNLVKKAQDKAIAQIAQAGRCALQIQNQGQGTSSQQS